MMLLDRFMLPGVDIQIKLWPSKNDFVLMKEEATTTGAPYKIKITDLYLDVLKITANPEIVTSQNMALMKTPAMYPYKRNRIQTYSLASGSMLFREDLVFKLRFLTGSLLVWLTAQPTMVIQQKIPSISRIWTSER